MVARVGGDEFAILLDSIPASELPGKAARITQDIGRLRIPYAGGCLIPSISTGWTAVEGGVKSTELLLRADRSMYNAKQSKKIRPLI